jgi:hypothetical protein
MSSRRSREDCRRPSSSRCGPGWCAGSWPTTPGPRFRACWAKRARAEGFDPDAAERLWWHSYVSVTRFVATGDLPPGDPALERALGARDASDLPTFKLASLLAPTVVLAADVDLQAVGLAYDRWWEVPEAVRNMVAGHDSADLAARIVFGAGYGAVAAIRAAARAFQRPRVAIAVIAVAAVAAVARHGTHTLAAESPRPVREFARLRAVSGMWSWAPSSSTGRLSRSGQRRSAASLAAPSFTALRGYRRPTPSP